MRIVTRMPVVVHERRPPRGVRMSDKLLSLSNSEVHFWSEPQDPVSQG